ncbi:MAG TPA: hypothetical protein ENL13_02500 [Thermoplasmatales archaeon]|nr:hypothetical protein [Thermoplasmatales archaeon]
MRRKHVVPYGLAVMFVTVTVFLLVNETSADIYSPEPLWEEGRYWSYNIFKLNASSEKELTAAATIEVGGLKEVQIGDKSYLCRLVHLHLTHYSSQSASEVLMEEYGVFYYLNDTLKLVKFEYTSPYPFMNVTITYDPIINVTPSPFCMFSIAMAASPLANVTGDVGCFIDYPLSLGEIWSGEINVTVIHRSLGETKKVRVEYKAGVDSAGVNFSTPLGNLSSYGIMQSVLPSTNSNSSSPPSSQHFIFSNSTGVAPVEVSNIYTSIFTGELSDYGLKETPEDENGTPAFLAVSSVLIIVAVTMFLMRWKSGV